MTCAVPSPLYCFCHNSFVMSSQWLASSRCAQSDWSIILSLLQTVRMGASARSIFPRLPALVLWFEGSQCIYFSPFFLFGNFVTTRYLMHWWLSVDHTCMHDFGGIFSLVSSRLWYNMTIFHLPPSPVPLCPATHSGLFYIHSKRLHTICLSIQNIPKDCW